jgi:AcrR family transcriptional regulator
MSLAVRAPRQQRTREQWTRILDAGVALLEDDGYDAFTIPAICERAGVPPRALYARADSKDALFLAVYEHGMQRISADHAPFSDPTLWDGLSDAARVGKAVDTIAGIFETHQRLLRAIVLVSGAHPEVARRGAQYRRQLCDQFAAVLDPLDETSTRSNAAAREFAFSLAFSALVVRTAYGVDFGIPRETAELKTAVTRYLLIDGAAPALRR